MSAPALCPVAAGSVLPLQAVYHHLNDSAGISRQATVRNVSPTAVRLAVPRPIRLGKVLSLRLSSPRRSRPLTRLVLVVGLRCQGPAWTVIGLFTDPLREEEWLSLQPEDAG